MLRWLQAKHPHFLERLYRLARLSFMKARPLISFLGVERADQLLRPAEELSKKALFDCRMCGQCILHSTGMTCPMTCPKNLRNGPCGGVRTNGHCEVIPEMPCVWVEAYNRSLVMPIYGDEMRLLQPPVNRQLEGTSAWINMASGSDAKMPAGWVALGDIEKAPAADVKSH